MIHMIEKSDSLYTKSIFFAIIIAIGVILAVSCVGVALLCG